MEPTTMKAYGRRLLPQILDDLASSTPGRLYASVPRDGDLDHGFVDISCQDMARCANYMAHWIRERPGQSLDVSTICYFGIPDLCMVPTFFGAVKWGFKVLLPSPRNPPAVNHSLLQQTNCTIVLHSRAVHQVVKQLSSLDPAIQSFEMRDFDTMLQSSPDQCDYDYDYDDVKDRPIVVLHSSGSTGIPKPITMTHATFSVHHHERNLARVPGLKNRDYSIWDFPEGGRFYTVFPYFHLAGFLCLIVNPTITESSNPVLGPPLMPPSGGLLRDVMKQQKLKALYIPPSTAEQALQDPKISSLFEQLDFLCYTGGPFSDASGEILSRVTELCPLYGSIEAFKVPQLAPAKPEDWAWMEWNPCFKLTMEISDDEPDVYELVLFADSSTEEMSALNHNLPGTSVYRTKDLFKRHPDPAKPTLWKYHARRDDIIVLSNGEKFNPVPMELFLQSHPSVAGALVLGTRRTQAALLLEASPEIPDSDRAKLLDILWPHVEKGNLLVAAQGRITRSNVLLESPEKPFVRAGKGTIIRRLTEEKYTQELDALYKSNGIYVKETASLHSTITKPFDIEDVRRFVRGVVIEAFPGVAEATNDNDLFAQGLDSVKIIQLVAHLREEVRAHGQGDSSRINARIIFRARNITTLAKVVAEFLNKGKFHSK